MMKSKFLATLAAIGLATASLVGIAAPAAATPEPKVYVCKYVTTPGGVEKLQTGNNPIEVSVNAIPNYQGVGSSFADGQGRSYVLGVVGEIPEPDAGDCPAPTPADVATASVSTTPATCESAESLVLGAVVNATWGAVTDPPGPNDYSVTAAANEGAEFAGELTEITFTGTLDPQLTGEGCDGEPDLATASLAFTPASCFADEQPNIAGSSISHATWGTDSDATLLGYTIVATADSGAEFVDGDVGGLTKTFTGTLDPQFADTDERCLGTLGPVRPSVSFTQITCDADGSYTLGSPTEGDADKLEWTVNGIANIPSGSYAINTSKTVTIQAHAIQPDVLEFDWVDPEPFDFVVPTGCDLETLALTGSSTTPWTLNAGIGVLMLGAAMMLMRRRAESLFD